MAARGDGLTGFAVRDRQRPGERRPPVDEEMLAIRLVEPLPRNAAALGINLRSSRRSPAAGRPPQRPCSSRRMPSRCAPSISARKSWCCSSRCA
ncbi:hypothetical protein [Paucibacter sp. XJ19-41]|uniref:hypothetical protein n=1 Tax=Paucibacter sp. XJ19-41 TaxID=2927824 RepID=UPI003FA7E7F9